MDYSIVGSETEHAGTEGKVVQRLKVSDSDLCSTADLKGHGPCVTGERGHMTLDNQ